MHSTYLVGIHLNTPGLILGSDRSSLIGSAHIATSNDVQIRDKVQQRGIPDNFGFEFPYFMSEMVMMEGDCQGS